MLLVPTTRHRPSRTLSLVIMHRLPHGVKSTRTRSRLTGALRTSRGSRTASSASRRCTLKALSLDKCIAFMTCRLRSFGGSKFSYSDLSFVASSDIIIIPECAKLVGKYCFYCMKERQTKGPCARHRLLHNNCEVKYSATTYKCDQVSEASPRPTRKKKNSLQIRGAKTQIRLAQLESHKFAVILAVLKGFNRVMKSVVV